jgi:predicted Ser/Thr protein kinase
MPKEYIEYQNEITSADELNKQGRKSDVLITTLEKCQVLEKQLGIAREGIRDIQRIILVNNGRLGECHREYKEAEKILKRIEEVKQ